MAGPWAGELSSILTAGAGRAGTAATTQLLPAMGRAGSAVESGAARVGSADSAVASHVGTTAMRRCPAAVPSGAIIRLSVANTANGQGLAD